MRPAFAARLNLSFCIDPGGKTTSRPGKTVLTFYQVLLAKLNNGKKICINNLDLICDAMMFQYIALR
jgi:hypothetical protein